MSDTETQVKNWLLLSVELIGVTLTILTLMWTFGIQIRIVSYMLLIAFIIFINAVTTNSKLIYEAAHKAEARILRKWESFAEYSFGIGFTLVICAFAIGAYVIMNKDLVGPTLFMGSAWIIMIIYNGINAATKGTTKKLAALRDFKRMLWLIMELVVLILLYLDWFGVVVWTELVI